MTRGTGKALGDLPGLLFGTWRSAFFAFGGLGLVLGAVFLAAFGGESGTSGPSGADGPKPTLAVSLRAYFGCKSVLLASEQ